MELKVKFLKWSAGLPVAMLNKDTAEQLGVHINDRISLKAKSGELSTIVNTIGSLVKKNEIGISSEIKTRLKLKESQKVEVNFAPSPKSLLYIKEKLNNKTPTKNQINKIIQDIVNNSLSEVEISLFISGMYKQGMTMQETIHLINAILKYGNKLKLKNKLIVDKHSIGGIPGRTTPIIVSICAAAGLTMPKTSSRAITTPAGTADVMETLAQVNFSMSEVKKIVNKTGACIVWGGGLEMVPADSKIIKIEKKLNIDPEAQLLASIMSKKLAVNAKYILIHIPYGKSAKVTKQKAMKLKTKFEQLGKHFKKKLKVVLTKNNGPTGNGIGPALEMIDVIKILDPKQNGPEELEEKSILLSAQLLELTGKAKPNQGEQLAKEILDSGKAFEKFEQIIKAQKGKIKKLSPAKFKKNILSKKSGKIFEINNKKINLLARTVGCPADKRAGLYLYFHVGDKVKKKEKILTIYAESKSRLNQAAKFYNDNKPIKIR